MNIFSWFREQQPSVSFSLDNGYLRYVVLDRYKDRVVVLDHGSEYLGSEVITTKEAIIDDASFVRSLRRSIEYLRKENNFSDINFVIPNQQAIMFHTHVAKMPEKEMNDVITDHLATYCESNHLLEYKDYLCEYDIILETDFGYDVHATLVPKNYIAHLNRLCKQAGVSLVHIETAHHAVSRACLETGSGQGIVFIAFGESKTSVSLLHGEHLISEETIDLGLDSLITTIERYLRVSKNEAQKILEKHGLLLSHPDNGLLGELYVTLAPIYRSIDRQLITVGKMPYKTFGHRFTTKDCVVYGAVHAVKGFTEFISEKTGLKVQILDVWAGHHEHAVSLLNLPVQEVLMYAEPIALGLLHIKQ